MSSISKEDLDSLICSHNFEELFIKLGWDREGLSETPLRLSLSDGEIDKADFQIDRVAQKRGFAVCVCDAGEHYPASKNDRRRLLNQLARHHYEHLLIIYGEGKQCWTVSIRPQDRPLRIVEVEWHEAQDIQPLMEKLNGMIFDISEEEGIAITDVVDRVRTAFMENAEKITKKVLPRVSGRNCWLFLEFIEGYSRSKCQRSGMPR